jgi:tetratricopeptide (TPR) repeat protein
VRVPFERLRESWPPQPTDSPLERTVALLGIIRNRPCAWVTECLRPIRDTHVAISSYATLEPALSVPASGDPELTSFDALSARLHVPAHAGEPVLHFGGARIALLLGEHSDDVFDAATSVARRWLATRPGAALHAAAPACTWPFISRLTTPIAPALVFVPDLHDAFVNRQRSVRLVTTQAAYLLQAWLDATKDGDIFLLATAARSSVTEHAPELLAGRGALAADLYLHIADPPPRGEKRWPARRPSEPALTLLVGALRTADPEERLRLCVEALSYGRTPGALVATASACMENADLDAAARDLDEALAAAPEWAAAHFERGKVWLRLDDMEQAAHCFRAAATRMPRFAAAWANLGATLGELDRPSDALEAFERALACEPDSPQALNNIGVVNRELGNLSASEAAFRRVTQLAPDLAFGYYNLGHTLFLQGRYQVALHAYVEGQSRDPEGNPVQASRLALCRLALGDAAGALRDLKAATSTLPREYKQQLLADTNAIAWALLTHRPDLPGWKQVNDWLAAELASLS